MEISGRITVSSRAMVGLDLSGKRSESEKMGCLASQCLAVFRGDTEVKEDSSLLLPPSRVMPNGGSRGSKMGG